MFVAYLRTVDCDLSGYMFYIINNLEISYRHTVINVLDLSLYMYLCQTWYPEIF